MSKIKKKSFCPILFEVKSKLGSLVRTTGTYWNIITHIKHPTVLGSERKKRFKLPFVTQMKFELVKRLKIFSCFIIQ